MAAFASSSSTCSMLLGLFALALLCLFPTASAVGPTTPVNCTLVGSCSKPPGLKYQCKLVNLGSTPLVNPYLKPQFKYAPVSVPDGCITPTASPYDPYVNAVLPSFGNSKTFSFCQNLTAFTLNPSFTVDPDQYISASVSTNVASSVPLNLTCTVSGYSVVLSSPTVNIKCTIFNFNNGLYARNIIIIAYAGAYDYDGDFFYIYPVGTSGCNIDGSINGPLQGNSKNGSPYSFTLTLAVPFSAVPESGPTFQIVVQVTSAFLTAY